MISPGRVRLYTEQAQVILSVARHTNGWFPQRKKLSAFGRTYYSGISVQNVNKELRRAMLGHCWEYDIRSSIVTWKMTFARELSDKLYPTKEWKKVFRSTLLYLEDRADFMRDVRREMFATPTTLSVEFQEQLIKEAVTAISFGARAKGVGWCSQSGSWTNPALVDIIKNGVQRAAFLNSPDAIRAGGGLTGPSALQPISVKLEKNIKETKAKIRIRVRSVVMLRARDWSVRLTPSLRLHSRQV